MTLSLEELKRQKLAELQQLLAGHLASGGRIDGDSEITLVDEACYDIQDSPHWADVHEHLSMAVYELAGSDGFQPEPTDDLPRADEEDISSYDRPHPR